MNRHEHLLTILAEVAQRVAKALRFGTLGGMWCPGARKSLKRLARRHFPHTKETFMGWPDTTR